MKITFHDASKLSTLQGWKNKVNVAIDHELICISEMVFWVYLQLISEFLCELKLAAAGFSLTCSSCLFACFMPGNYLIEAKDQNT